MRTFLLALALASISLFARAQDMDTALTNRFLLNFSVPDMPAFKALGTDPSNILRPSDIKKFAASISPFYSNGQGVIPKNFALEIAPWKLLSRKWDIAKYNKGAHSVLYNSGFSVGTIQDSGAYSSKLSIGYRLTIAKKGDILKALHDASNVLRKQLAMTPQRFAALEELSQHWMFEVKQRPRGQDAAADRQFVKANNVEFLTFVKGLKGTADANLKRMYDAFATAFDIKNDGDMDALIKANADLEKVIDGKEGEVIDAFKEDMWNANRFDLALAWVGASADSLLKNAQFSSFNIWSTYAIGIGKNGQLLLGTNVILPRTEKNDTVSANMVFTGNIRYYHGSNSVKGFIESQYKYQNYSGLQRSLLFNLGAEFRIGQQFWVVAGAGVNNYLGLEKPLSTLVSSVSLRYGFNAGK